MKQRNEKIAKTATVVLTANMLLTTCFILNRIVKTATSGNPLELIGFISASEVLTTLLVNMSMLYSFNTKGHELRPAQNILNNAQNKGNHLYSESINYIGTLFSTKLRNEEDEIRENKENDRRNADNRYENIITGGACYFDLIYRTLKP